MKKKPVAAIALTLAVYILFLLALTAAESSCPGSGIRSFWDALWYSVVTITTVGYGDLYPVSPAGKAIGAFFLLLSVGALAFAVSFIYAAMTGRFIPRIRLFLGRHKPWYVFSELNEASAALARDIARREPDSLIVFAASSSAPGIPDAVCLPESLPDAHLADGKAYTAFFMSGDAHKNSDDALTVMEGKCPPTRIYCMGEGSAPLPGVQEFDPFTCCARQYWQAYPLSPEEQNVVIAGSGKYARALLSQALLALCRAPFAASTYHLFGDWSEYKRRHPLLLRALENAQDSTQDRLVFHDHPWNGDIALLEHADRIIFCEDEEADNARCAGMLERLYAHSAGVYVRTASRSVSGVRFGHPQDVFTAEMVMKQALDKAAVTMHEAYRSAASGDVPAWDNLSSFLKASNRAAADHMLTKARLLLPGEDVRALTPDTCRRAYEAYTSSGEPLRSLCRENEHERWMRFHLYYNWQYAPQRDNAMRRHPSLIPFASLSEAEQAKDDHAWQLLASFSVRSEEHV